MVICFLLWIYYHLRMFIEFLLFKQYWKILVITKWSLLHMKDLYRSLAVPTLAEAEVACLARAL